MNCRECQEKLSLYLDGQLTDEERRRLEEALERCPDCARDLASLKDMVTTLHEVEPVAVPDDLLGQLQKSLRREIAASSYPGAGHQPSLLGRLGRWRVAASFLAVMFAAWVVYQDQVVRPGERRTGVQLEDAVVGDGDEEAEYVTLEDFDHQRDAVEVGSPEPSASMSPAPPPAGGGPGRVEKKSRKTRRARVPSSGQDRKSGQSLSSGRRVPGARGRVKSTLTASRDLDAIRRAVSAVTGEDFRPQISGMKPGKAKNVPSEEQKRLAEDEDKLSSPSRGFTNAAGAVANKTGGPEGAAEKARETGTVIPHAAYLMRSVRGLRPVEEAAAKLGIRGLVRQPIRSLEEGRGHRAQDSRDSAEDLGVLVTVTVTREQEKALLEALSRDRGTSLQLFARNSEVRSKYKAPPAKKDASWSAPGRAAPVKPASRSVGTGGQGKSSTASRPSPGRRAGQVRLSFVVLKRP